jgi:hypothetical protein
MTAGARLAHAAAEAAATQHTLNYALGNLGGKQKAWMYASSEHPNASIIRRKPAHPARPQPAELQPSEHPQAGQEALSNSTSPQLANVLHHLAPTQNLPSPTTVLPSPSPSVEVERISTPETNTIFHGGPLSPTDRNQTPALVQDGHVPAQVASPDLTSMEEVRRHASAMKRPASGTQQTRPRPPPLNADSLHRPSFQQLAHGQNVSPATASNPNSPFPTNPQQQGQSPQQSPYLQYAAPQGLHNPMHNQQQVQMPTGLAMPYGQISHNPGQQVPVVPSNDQNPRPVVVQGFNGVDSPSEWCTQLECTTALDALYSEVPIVNGSRDDKRIGVLREAVARQDWAYLTMHQYYCVLDVTPTALSPAIRQSPCLGPAVSLMRSCLDNNATLSPAVLLFFAQFPKPLESLEQHYPQRFAEETTNFWIFMHLSVNFNKLQMVFEQRNCPPLMHELVRDFGIKSVVFQRILFTSTIRRLWFTWNATDKRLLTQLESQAVGLFYANQAHFYQREALRPNDEAHFVEFDSRERQVEKQQFGAQLQQLCNGYKQRFHQQIGSMFPDQPPLAGGSLSHLQMHQPLPQNNRRTQSSTARRSFAQTLSTTPQHNEQAADQRRLPRGRPRGRPRLYPTAPRPQPVAQPVAPRQPVVSQQVAQVARPAQQSKTRLLPARGNRQPQQREPNPARFGLHQAHLRSPLLRAKSTKQKLYQHVEGFLRAPARVSDASHKIEKWSFTLTSEAFERIPAILPDDTKVPAIRDVDEQSRLLRLRCVKWASEAPNEHAWAIADTSWIRYSYFKLNGHSLEQRKKLHHGKDLPIDISPFVKEGENTLEIAVMRQRKDESYRNYLVAIEVLAFKSLASIVKGCQENNRITAPDMLARIQKKLSPNNDDDDFAIVESNLSINLFDPFSASKMCDIPVRGRACLHYDCFDLDTFLQTRRSKGDATVADQWKCPICNCDARPQHLIIDGFLESVRAKLYESGLQDTRAIIVDQDGSWKPKAEVRDPNSVQDRDTPDDDAGAPNPQRQPSLHAEVIDLSD